MTWSQERIDELSQLRADKLSNREIAERLGVTKNAISGACDRYGVPKRAPGYRNRVVMQEDIKKGLKPPPKKRKPWKLRSGPPLIPAKLVENIPDQNIPVEQRKTIMELTSSTCRWPVNDPGTVEFFYCGAHVEELCGPYCPSHRKRAHVQYVRRTVGFSWAAGAG